jgi:hypothetical protein
MCVKPDYFF